MGDEIYIAISIIVIIIIVAVIYINKDEKYHGYWEGSPKFLAKSQLKSASALFKGDKLIVVIMTDEGDVSTQIYTFTAEETSEGDEVGGEVIRAGKSWTFTPKSVGVSNGKAILPEMDLLLNIIDNSMLISSGNTVYLNLLKK